MVDCCHHDNGRICRRKGAVAKSTYQSERERAFKIGLESSKMMARLVRGSMGIAWAAVERVRERMRERERARKLGERENYRRRNFLSSGDDQGPRAGGLFRLGPLRSRDRCGQMPMPHGLSDRQKANTPWKPLCLILQVCKWLA
jgi:hypothetical protein